MRKMLLAVFVLSVSCDGSSHKTGNLAACGDFTPCGGSLVGAWKMSKLCSEIMTSTTERCTSTMDIREYDPDITLTFSSDGTFSSQGTVNAKAEFEYPKACFVGVTLTCDRLGSISVEGITMSCTSNTAGDCHCTETVSNKSVTDQGTYTTSGATLTVTQSGDESAPADYCVQGNTLKLRNFDSSEDVTSGSTIAVLTKQ